jgi:hypothetical protein
LVAHWGQLEEGSFWWPLIQHGHNGSHLGFGFRRLSDERLSTAHWGSSIFTMFHFYKLYWLEEQISFAGSLAIVKHQINFAYFSPYNNCATDVKLLPLAQWVSCPRAQAMGSVNGNQTKTSGSLNSLTYIHKHHLIIWPLCVWSCTSKLPLQENKLWLIV